MFRNVNVYRSQDKGNKITLLFSSKVHFLAINRFSFKAIYTIKILIYARQSKIYYKHNLQSLQIEVLGSLNKKIEFCNLHSRV